VVEDPKLFLELQVRQGILKDSASSFGRQHSLIIYLLPFDILSFIFHLLRCVAFDTGCCLPLRAHRSRGSSSHLFGSEHFCGVWFEMSSLVVSIRLFI
jgi:hypothetical protein